MILEAINLAVSGAAIISTILTATKLHRIQRKNKNNPPPILPTIIANTAARKAKQTKSLPTKPEHKGTLPWSIYGAHGSQYGFRCPKCINVAKNKKQYPICTCDDYPREHYHFKCGDCRYTNILRTADDI